MIKTVAGTFESIAEAAVVARELRAAGFLDNDINVAANTAPRRLIRDDYARARHASEDAAIEVATGVVSGAAVGGAVGLAAGFLGLALPGLGPILAAGPVAAALLGAGTGAFTGGLIGSLDVNDIDETDATRDAEVVRSDSALVTIRTDASRTSEAERILRDSGAIEVEDRIARWRSAGSNEVDPNASPLPRLAAGDRRPTDSRLR